MPRAGGTDTQSDRIRDHEAVLKANGIRALGLWFMASRVRMHDRKRSMSRSRYQHLRQYQKVTNVVLVCSSA